MPKEKAQDWKFNGEIEVQDLPKNVIWISRSNGSIILSHMHLDFALRLRQLLALPHGAERGQRNV